MEGGRESKAAPVAQGGSGAARARQHRDYLFHQACHLSISFFLCATVLLRVAECVIEFVEVLALVNLDRHHAGETGELVCP